MQEGATVSSWVTFGVLVLTLVVAMLGATGWDPEPVDLAYAVDAYRGSVAVVNQEKAHEQPGGEEAWPRRSWRAASGFSLHLRRLAPGLNTWVTRYGMAPAAQAWSQTEA